MFRGSPRVTSLPFQLREATPDLEVRARNQDTGHAGWVDPEVADLERNLLIETIFAVAEDCDLCAFYLGPTGDLHSSGIGFSGLTTIDNGSTVILAGGDGRSRRLLSLTRRITGDDRPKQFCSVLGSETLHCQTRRRVAGMVPPKQILVVLSKIHEPFYRDELDGLEASSLLVQRYNRGTAPAIFYSLMHVQ